MKANAIQRERNARSIRKEAGRMARDFARSFYASKEWLKVREYCMKRDHFECQKCGQPAEEVHHIIHLSPQNIGDVSITLNEKNLICLCRDCHCNEHHKDRLDSIRGEKAHILQDVSFDENGDIIPPYIPPW